MIGNTNSLIGKQSDYENLNITLITNQSDYSDLVGTNIKVTYADKEQNYTYAGTMISIKIPAYVNYIVSFSEVDGYKTPDNIIGTAIADNSKTFTAEYKTELVSVTSNVEGAPITINGVKYTYDGNPITVKIAHGTEYQVIPENFDNLYTTDNFSYIANTFNRTIACTYTTSTLKVAITSNQSNDSLVSNTKITVKYGSTTTTVGNGEEINIPINTSITLTIPGKGTNGYKGTYSGATFTSDLTKTITNAGGQKLITVAYTTVLLTVNITSDGTIPTGYSATISQSGGPSYTQTTATATHKVIPGTSVTISASDVDGYGTPVSVTNSYSSNSTVEMQYTENSTGVYVRTVSGKDVKWSSWSESAHGDAELIVIKDETRSIAFPAKMSQYIVHSQPWGDSEHNYIDIPGVTTVPDRGGTDYNGYANTQAALELVNYTGSGTSAMTYFQDRDNFYIPGASEFYLIDDNFADVQSALAVAGDGWDFSSSLNEPYFTPYFWTSTELDDTYVHIVGTNSSVDGIDIWAMNNPKTATYYTGMGTDTSQPGLEIFTLPFVKI